VQLLILNTVVKVMCSCSKGFGCNSNLHAKYNQFYFFISVLFQTCSSYMIGYWPQSNNIPWYRTDAIVYVYLSQIRLTLRILPPYEPTKSRQFLPLTCLPDYAVSYPRSLQESSPREQHLEICQPITLVHIH
jgi:hypothetical protein